MCFESNLISKTLSLNSWTYSPHVNYTLVFLNSKALPLYFFRILLAIEKIICRLFNAFWKIRKIFVNVFLKTLHWNYNDHYVDINNLNIITKICPYIFCKHFKIKTRKIIILQTRWLHKLLHVEWRKWLDVKYRGAQRSCWFILFLGFREGKTLMITSQRLHQRQAAGLRVSE